VRYKLNNQNPSKMGVSPLASLPSIITNCQNNENMLLILTINFTKKKSKKTGKVKKLYGYTE
jgi:hypothetical protein